MTTAVKMPVNPGNTAPGSLTQSLGTITGIDGNIAEVVMSSGTQKVRIDMTRGKSGVANLPAVGETWILDRVYGQWLFAVLTNAPIPPPPVAPPLPGTGTAHLTLTAAGTAVLNVPNDTWQYPTLSNSWVAYDGGYLFAQPRFFVDRKGKVRLGGLIASGTTGTIFTLPAQLVPDALLVFEGVAASNGGEAEIRIDTSGNVSLQAYNSTSGAASNAFVSLDRVSFFPASASIPWVSQNVNGLWFAFGSGTSHPRYYVDADNIVHWTGLMAGGATGNFATLATIATPDFQLISVGAASGGVARLEFLTSNQASVTAYNGGTNAYVSLDGIEYPNSSCTLNKHIAAGFGFVNSWVAFGAPYLAPAFYIDSAGIVRMRGVMKSGTTTPGTPLLQTIPFRFRPDYQSIFNALTGGDALSRVDMNPSGQTLLSGLGTGASNVYLSLENIRWPTTR